MREFTQAELQKFSGSESSTPSVRDDMGDIMMQCVWISPDKTRIKHAHAQVSRPAHNTWRRFDDKITSEYVVALSSIKPSPTSRSGYSWDVLGILFVLNDHESLQTVSKMLWDRVRVVTGTFAKMNAYYEASCYIATHLVDHPDEGFVDLDVLRLLEVCTLGGLKDVKKYVKGK